MTALLVGFACFVAHVAVTLVWLRLPGRISPVMRHVVTALATHAFGVFIASCVVGPFAYWPAAAASGFGAVCWLFAYSAVYKSVSLRILSQLAHTPEYTLPMATITSDYVRPEFKARALVLVKMGCVEESPDGYSVTEKGKRSSRRIAAVQRACGIEASGMYAAGESRLTSASR